MSVAPAYIITKNSISIYIEGKLYNITQSHKNFELIKGKIKEEDFENLEELLDLPKYIQKSAGGKVVVEDDNILYQGQPVHNVLVTKIFKMLDEGFSIEPMINFLENLYDNPSKTSIDELYLFLESGNLPITQDGHFLAYKKVRADYKDVHSGQFDNSVGQTLEMPRRDVDDKRDNTCSHGFHFCSKDYLQNFGGDRIVVLKINPKDVVSIPSDYNNTKGRTCKYVVIGELDEEIKKAPETAFQSTVDDRWDNSYYDDADHDYSDTNSTVENEEYPGLREGYIPVYKNGKTYFRNENTGRWTSREDALLYPSTYDEYGNVFTAEEE